VNEDQTVRQLVDDLSSAALRDLLRNVRHHTELRRRVASGMIDERTVNQAYREYARREGAGYRQQVADITLQYYSDLIDLGNNYSERFYDHVFDGAASVPSPNGHGADRASGQRPPSDADPPEADRDEIPIEMHGPPGREVVATFALENTETRPVELTVDVGACQGPDDESFLAPLTVNPARFVLEPGGSRSVTMRLVVLPSVFTPGHLYRLPVTVRGLTELVLRLTIWAEEPDAAFGITADETAAPSDASAAAAATSPPAGPDDAPSARPDDGGFVVRCPSCGRDFERAERTTRLYPHKTPGGDACPARKGRPRRAPPR
jgi:hypothetical protein